MDPSTLSSNQQRSLDLAVERALHDFELDPSFGRMLRAMALRPADAWMTCCNGGCDPCMLTLGRAANEVRARLPWLDLGHF